MSLLHLLGRAAVLALVFEGALVAAERGATDSAGDACEAAVAGAVRDARGRAAREIRFIGDQRAVSTTPGEPIGVKGEGRYTGPTGAPTPFTYTCAFDPASRATHGVLFSEKARTAPPPSQTAAVDLSRLSPESCEAATAAALKARHPRVDRISFGSDSRRLTPAAGDHTLLDGRGAVARAPGMNAVAFSYRCEFDNRSGKLLRVSTDE
ncbi:MAG: hypothetical protein ABIO45_14900 [Burkholderiaceae bacterium]